MNNIVLASKSPRRIELLRRIGLCFTVDPADIDETIEPTPDAAGILSLRKAEAVTKRHPPSSIIIAADTIVVCKGQYLGKPKDKDDAFRILKFLSGNSHVVHTGVTIIKGEQKLTESEATTVTFLELSDQEITSYIDTLEPMDKAGAYGIQDKGALLVRRIDGDFYNVMGLPLCTLGKMLKEFGVMLIKG